jgi:hypothetical protein
MVTTMTTAKAPAVLTTESSTPPVLSIGMTATGFLRTSGRTSPQNFSLRFCGGTTNGLSIGFFRNRSTVGMKIAYHELKERTLFMRRMKGENVFPLVILSETSMRTNFGIKLRPNFEIVEWRALGASGH